MMKKNMMLVTIVLSILMSSMIIGNVTFGSQQFAECPYNNSEITAAGVCCEHIVIAYQYKNAGESGIYLVDDQGNFVDIWTGYKVYIYDDAIQVNENGDNAIFKLTTEGFSIYAFTYADW